MRKVKTGSVRIPSPFSTSIHKTEWTCAAKIAEWINELIRKKGLPLGRAEVETTQEGNRKRADIVVFETPLSQSTLCVIEMKQPYFDPIDEVELKEPARHKASQRGARYFATSNFQHLYWFDTHKVNELRPLEEQVQDKYFLSQIEDLDLIEDYKYKNSILSALDRFISELYEVNSGKKPEPKLAIDELLIYRIHDKILRLARYYTGIIENRCHKDADFTSNLGKWFNEQGWDFTLQSQDYDKTARQTAYLLVNKILFYEALQAKRPEKLDPLQIPEGLTKGAQLQKILQSFFDEVLKIDYETIYTTDFIDNIAFSEEKEIVKEVSELVNILRQYDFAKLGYDVIGRIFERLIPHDERHNLGQYFTNADIVDIIIEFCLKHPDDKVFDPACGAGTFLVRAYQHKKLMNQYMKHEDILNRLWGNDVAKFPAHLTTINLAINDLATDKNYPNVLQEDFFKLLSTEGGFELPQRWRRARSTALHVKETESEYPRWFDCIVGNPPYTRQEEISEIAPKDKGYKENLIDRALLDNKGRQLAEISKRAGIYAYFFVHGTKFLQNGGRFGFIVSNSWLDVDYGKGLQRFFLLNYKIIAVIESKVERWFEDADINTCIVILEKCSGDDNRRQRNEHLARFVYLKKPLRYFIPAAQNIWERQLSRHNAIQDKFIKTIMAHNELYDDGDIRIYPKKQSELWEEGYDAEGKKYVGSKWGKYLRAPDIFFKVLEKGKDKLVPLKQIAEVRFGIKTGADPWFYVKDITDTMTKDEISIMARRMNYKGNVDDLRLILSGDGSKWLVERMFSHLIARNPDDFKNILIEYNKVNNFVISVSEQSGSIKKNLIYRYITHGQSHPYNMGKGRRGIPSNTKTCSSRTNWYQLSDIAPSRILWEKAFDRCHRHFWVDKPILANQRFYPIYPYNSENTELIAAFLNSPLTSLYLEFQRTVMGLGAVESTVDEAKQALVLNPEVVDSKSNERVKIALGRLSCRPVDSIFFELGASSPDEVSLDKVKPDRRELDKIIMGNILGLSDDEQLEVYRAVIDLVKSRLDKAKTFGNRKKTKNGIDIDLLIKTLMDKVGENTLVGFYQEKILNQRTLYNKTLPSSTDDIAIRETMLGWRLYSGKNNIDCASEFEARYLKVWLEAGITELKVPKDEDYLKTIVPEIESLKAKIDTVIDAHLGFIANPRTKDRILRQVWHEINREPDSK